MLLVVSEGSEVPDQRPSVSEKAALVRAKKLCTSALFHDIRYVAVDIVLVVIPVFGPLGRRNGCGELECDQTVDGLGVVGCQVHDIAICQYCTAGEGESRMTASKTPSSDEIG